MGKRLIEFIGDYITGRLLEKVGARDDAEFRCSFAGPPVLMLEELFTSLVDPGKSLVVRAGEEIRQVAVYLLDADVEDPPTMVKSGRCTGAFLVKARTARQVQEFLALHRMGEGIDQSLDTTIEPIGCAAEHEEAVQWLNEPLIDALLERTLSHFGLAQLGQARAAVRRAVEVAWVRDERYQDKPNAWSVINRLADGVVPGDKSGHLGVAAALGFPACAADDFGTKSHLEILSRISQVLSAQGLSSGFAQLRKNAENGRAELIPHIDAFRDHVGKTCFEASDFIADPHAAYAVSTEAGKPAPAWWEALDAVAWSSLLDDDDGERVDLAFEVILTNTVAHDLPGLPALVQSEAEFKLRVQAIKPYMVIAVSRANGSAKFEPLDPVTVQQDEDFRMSLPVPPHQRFVRFRFEPLKDDGSASDMHAKAVKLIALDSYIPGIVVYSRPALRATPFKMNAKARDQDGRIVQRLEADMTLPGTGTHQVDIFKGVRVELGSSAVGYNVNNDEDGIVERPINPVSDGHAACLVECDEECHYEFSYRADPGHEPVTCRLHLTAGEVPPTGASSEFDRLVIEHRASAKGKHANTRVESMATRLQDFEIGALDETQSYRPVILGPDFIDAWIGSPKWEQHPVISRKPLILDPRPDVPSMQAPDAFIKSREALRIRLRGDTTQPATSIQMLPLHEYMGNGEFEACLVDYLQAYLDWLSRDYAEAAWCDVVSVHAAQAGGNALETRPYAVLLAPFHPVRLAWQCRSQSIMQDALQRHFRCPAASIVQPSYFPDCLLLPCVGAAGDINPVPFVAMASTSDYWSVLWSAAELDRLRGADPDPVFGGTLGLRVEGLGSGFSEQQVERAMSEVSRLMAARSTLSVALSSETTGTSGCNEGLENWARDNLGDEADVWREAGGRSLLIHDERAVDLQPEPATLAGLTAATGTAMRWFANRADGIRPNVDLAIVAQLGTANHEFKAMGLRSAVDATILSRFRVRKRLPAGSGIFVAESRVGKFPLASATSDLVASLASCIDLIEQRCAAAVDTYIFAPQMAALDTAISRAGYTAVSSSNLDVACFLGAAGNAYLWDYELPSYGRRSGENSGYFLLAAKSPTMVRAMQGAVSTLTNVQEVSEEQAKALLDEVSSRGMPTLKRLTTGGTVSVGEAGLLVALRLLQTEFDGSGESAGLIPAFTDDESVTLLVPADPFAGQFDDLRMAFEGVSGERPDLIAISVLFRREQPIVLKMTPLEVKARATTTLSASDRLGAIQQARKFSAFLEAIRQRASSSELWALAWANLVGSLLDFAFRVYGQLACRGRTIDWSHYHQATMVALLSRELPIVIDMRGRLIVVDGSATAKALDDDRDGFNESLVLSRADAIAILRAPGGGGIVDAVRGHLGDWELVATGQDEPDVKSPGALEDGSSLVIDGGPIPPSEETSVLRAEEVVEVQPAPSAEASANEEPQKANAVPDEGGIECPPVGIAFAVGVTASTIREQPVYFRPGDTALNQLNVGIVGDLGTGKTQLIQALIYQLRRAADLNRGIPPNVLIFDYKRDYSKPEFVEATGARVVAPFDLPLNIFDTRGMEQGRNAWLGRYKFFSDVLGKIYGGIGPVQQVRIKAAVKQAFENTAGLGKRDPTLLEVFQAYADAEAKIDSPYGIMSDLVDSETFVTDPSKVMLFEDFIRGVTVVNLADVGQDDRTKNMIVAVFLNLFYDHMLKIEKRPFVGIDPSYRFIDTMLLVDEADNIMQYEFDVLRKILLQGREFGVGVILASQYLSHFRTSHENYLEPLLTWFIHKVPDVKVQDLSAIGLANPASDMVETVKSLQKHHCLIKTLGVDGEFMRAYPFYELVKWNSAG